jgi:hypothetical protein
MNPDEDIYRRIEQRYGFAIPEEYRQMRARGWFDCADGTMPYFNPASRFYLWMNDMEWMSLHDILEFEFPSYCKPGFIPFAFTAGGDHWCWYPEHTSNGITPAMHCPRDSKMGEYYAPHFLGALYRQALSFAAEPLDAKEELEARQHLKRWFDDLGPLFPFGWRETLAALLTAPAELGIRDGQKIQANQSLVTRRILFDRAA